jgi:hypothetical protein
MKSTLAGVDGQRPVEVVDHAQQLQQQVSHRLVGLLAPLAFDPLAIVVELGALAQPPILEVVALALDLARLGAIGRLDGGVGSIGHGFISHIQLSAFGDQLSVSFQFSELSVLSSRPSTRSRQLRVLLKADS